jgi:hypothetical protein
MLLGKTYNDQPIDTLAWEDGPVIVAPEARYGFKCPYCGNPHAVALASDVYAIVWCPAAHVVVREEGQIVSITNF